MKKQINANEVECMKEGCKEKGYRWIVVDPDIAPLCYCKKHIVEFEINLMKELEK